MKSEVLLMAIAQIAVALIGFSGVVTTLGHSRGAKWTAAELLQLRTHVEPSMVALFGALVPSTICLVVDSPALLWRISNAILVLTGSVSMVRYLYRTRRSPTLWSQRVLFVVSLLVLLAMILGALDVVPKHEFTFVLGLWVAMAVGVHNFALLLFRVEADDG